MNMNRARQTCEGPCYCTAECSHQGAQHTRQCQHMSSHCLPVSVQPCKDQQIHLLCKEKGLNVAITLQPPAGMLPNKTDIPVHKHYAGFAILTHKSRLMCHLRCSMDPRNHHCPCRTCPWGSRSPECLVHQTVNDRHLLYISLLPSNACSKSQSTRLLNTFSSLVQQLCTSLQEASSSQHCSVVVFLGMLEKAGLDQLTRLKPSSHSQWYEPISLMHVWSHPAVPSKHSLMSEHCCPFPLHPTRVILKVLAMQHTTTGSMRAQCCDRSHSVCRLTIWTLADISSVGVNAGIQVHAVIAPACLTVHRTVVFLNVASQTHLHGLAPVKLWSSSLHVCICASHGSQCNAAAVQIRTA